MQGERAQGRIYVGLFIVGGASILLFVSQFASTAFWQRFTFAYLLLLIRLYGAARPHAPCGERVGGSGGREQRP